MRALTVKQPWASLIMAGVKDVENRTWPVPSTVVGCRTADGRLHSPLRIAVHAGLAVDYDAFKRHPDIHPLWGRPRYPTGVLLGYVTVVGCHRATLCAQQSCEHGPEKKCFAPCGPLRHCSPWADPHFNVYHWRLADPEPLSEPIPMRGQQGLWTLREAA